MVLAHTTRNDVVLCNLLVEEKTQFSFLLGAQVHAWYHIPSICAEINEDLTIH